MKGLKTLLAVFAAFALALPGKASAQDLQWRHAPSLDIQAFGGYQSYVGDVGDLLDSGPAYGLLLAFEPVWGVGLELSYMGATYRVNRLGDTSRVNENGGQAVVKAGPHLWMFEPYAFAGVGLTRLDSTTNTSRFVRDDTMWRIPLGLGVDMDLPVMGNHLLLGLRGTYAFGFGDQAFPTLKDGASTDQIQATLQLGTRF